MAIDIILINKSVVIPKIIFASVIGRINIDAIKTLLQNIIEGYERMIVIPFDDAVVQTTTANIPFTHMS